MQRGISAIAELLIKTTNGSVHMGVPYSHAGFSYEGEGVR